MREIKFRVWNGKKFLTSSYGREDKDYISIRIDGGILAKYGRSNYHDKLIIQQYTGLKDKNGKEIYEGDIVKFARTRIESVEEFPKIFSSKLIELGEDVGEIVYMGFSFCLSFDHKRYDDIEKIGNYPHRFEVIGNIFENPDFLK